MGGRRPRLPLLRSKWRADQERLPRTNFDRKGEQLTGQKYTGKVLVLGSDFKNYRSCLTTVRSLGRYGLEVHLGWCAANDITRSSRYIAKIHDIPAYSYTDDNWKKALIALTEKEKYDLVVPINEQASAPLEKNRQDFEQYPSIYLLNQKAYDIVFDKFKTSELASSLGINQPAERNVKSLSEIDTVIDEFAFPIVLKPSASFVLENLSKKHYVYKAYNPKELKTCLRNMLKDGDVLVQENFIGTGIGIEFLADNGKLLYAFEHIRVHEPLMGGGSSYRKSASLHLELLEAAKKLLSEMDYTGIGMAEFKYNFKTGGWIFLEINGRFWGSLPLAVAAGADFPRFLYQLRVEKKHEFTVKFRTGLFCRNTIRDFEWIISNISHDKSDPSRNTLPNRKVAKEVFNIISLRERNDTQVIDDIKPGLIELRQLISIASRRISEAIKANSPRRWYRTFKTRRSLSKAENVMFVCYGNIYRSPFAHYYARCVFPDTIRINSSGYLPRKDRPCHQRAIDIADEFGIDLSGHRSSVITEEMVRQADIILTFDKQNRHELIDKYPFAHRKIHLLGLLSFTGPVAIDDPVEGNLYTVRETYKTIKRAIDSFVNSGASKKET